MKSVNLSVFTLTKDKKYEIRLGNGTVHVFSTQIQIKKFLAETNRILSEILFQLNDVLTETMRLNREIWLLSKKIPEDNLNTTRLTQVEFHLNSIWGLSNTPYHKTASVLIYGRFEKAIRLLKKILKGYQAIYIKRSDTITRKKIDGLFKSLLIAEREIREYGQEGAYSLIDDPRFDEVLTNSRFKTTFVK